MFGRRFSAFSVWRFALTVFVIGGAVSLSALPSAAASDKILAHQRGSVQYTLDGSTKTIYTRLVVPDNATAVTGPKSLATLTMPDSSEIDIGERTSVRISDFNSIQSGKDNTISLNGGALHFIIRHPEGQQANYKFVTPTSQIAIRGTEGFLISNAGGTSLTITSGTASITALSSGVTVAVPAGTTGIVSVSGAATVSTTTSTLSVSSISGTSSATTGATTGIASSTTGIVAGGTAAGIGVAAAASQGNGGSSPTPQPSPSPSPAPSGAPPGPFLVGGGTFPASSNDVYATFPHSLTTQEITQSNCTTDATIAVTGPVTLNTTTLPCVNGSISGSISGSFTGPGAAQFTITGSGVTFTHVEDIYGALSATIGQTGTATITGADNTFVYGSINVTTVPQTIPISITQPGPAAVSFTSTLNCSNVASATNYNSFIGLGAVGTFSSSASSYSLNIAAAPTYAPGTQPTTAPPYACLLTIQGLSADGLTGTSFDTSASQVQLLISVTSASVGLQSDHRKLETSPGQRKIPTR
jgi:hypothetical protein